MSDGCEFVFKLCFGSEVFKLVDVVLESVIGSSILILPWLLEKPGYVAACFHLGVEGVKVLVIVCYEFVERFLFGFDCGVGHFVVPFF